jgi:hypothetical protein
VEKFHNSPPVDPVVSITTPEIKNRLGSWVRCSISVLVIGGMATAFAAEEENIVSDEPEAELTQEAGSSSKPTEAEQASLESQEAPTEILQGGEVLLIKDGNAWGSPANEKVLQNLNIAYDVINSSSIASTEFNYKLIIVASDQSQNFYNVYNANLTKFTNYVLSGGILQFNGGDRGWRSGFWSKLPGEVTHKNRYDGRNNIVKPEHPIADGVSNPFTGSSASHDYFIGIEAVQADTITTDTADNPTTIEYCLGAGRVIASGLTFEFGYKYGQGAGKVLSNTIKYAYNATPCAGPGKFEFSSKIYFANENSKNAIVKVVRKGGSTGVVSVNYATAAFEDRDTVDPISNPASEGEDYATTEGTLTWKDGEYGIQTFKVPLFNDYDEEGDETVQLLLSSPTGAALGDKEKISAKLRIADDECHGVYTTAARTLYHPLITVPVYDPISGQPTEDVQVFEGTFTLLNGTEDFIIDIEDQEQFNFVKNIKNVNKLKADCYAKYDWQTETFQIPYVDVPSIVVLPMGHSQVGPTQIFRAKMQQMPLSGEYGIGDFIFHVEGAPFQDASITADANASVKTKSKDEVETKVDASIEIAPDEYTYYQYLYTYDK